MNPIFQQIALIVAGQVVSCFVTVYLIRWKKRENKPRELEVAIDRLYKDLVRVREDVARIKGRLNGHEWKRE